MCGDKREVKLEIRGDIMGSKRATCMRDVTGEGFRTTPEVKELEYWRRKRYNRKIEQTRYQAS